MISLAGLVYVSGARSQIKKKIILGPPLLTIIIIIIIINMHKDARRRDVPCAGGAAA